MPQITDKKLHIKTYGCQMNVYDSEKMADIMATHGFSESDTIENSDLVILNTCHIREKAAEKVYSELGRIRMEKEKLRSRGKNMFIAVAGCVGQAEGEEIFTRAPFVDIVVGSQAYHRLPEMLANAERGDKKLIDLDFSPQPKFDSLPEESQADNQNRKISSFLSIQEGCDNFCTFCVVPYTRGAEFSRSVPEIYREALRLVQNGTKEITLLGQNVNAYHGRGLDGDEWDLGKLISHIAKINGLERIRYTTSHPGEVNDSLISVHKNVAKLMPFLHLPVQSGSDAMLKKMNRHHTADDYRNIIDKLRKARPDIEFSSDFIVGFPGESDKDFEQTMQLIRDVSYAQAYSFKYSPRPGTPAAAYDDQIPEDVKQDRLKQLQQLVTNQQQNYNESCVGKVMPVLFEKEGRHDTQMIGKSPYMQSVHVMNAEEYHGKMVDVRIDKLVSNSFSGTIVENI